MNKLTEVIKNLGPFIRVAHHVLISLEHLHGTSTYNTQAVQFLTKTVRPIVRSADGLINGYAYLPDEAGDTIFTTIKTPPNATEKGHNPSPIDRKPRSK